MEAEVGSSRVCAWTLGRAARAPSGEPNVSMACVKVIVILHLLAPKRREAAEAAGETRHPAERTDRTAPFRRTLHECQLV